MLPSLPVRGRPVPRLGLSEASAPAPTPPPPAPQEGRFCRSHLARAPGAGLERAGALCERAARLRQEAAGEAGGSPVPRLQGPQPARCPGRRGPACFGLRRQKPVRLPFPLARGALRSLPSSAARKGSGPARPGPPAWPPPGVPAQRAAGPAPFGVSQTGRASLRSHRLAPRVCACRSGTPRGPARVSRTIGRFTRGGLTSRHSSPRLRSGRPGGQSDQ